MPGRYSQVDRCRGSRLLYSWNRSSLPAGCGGTGHNTRHNASSAPGSNSSNTLVAGATSSAELSQRHVGKYYPIDEGRIPEAFDQWYSNRDRRPSRSVPIDGGGAIQPLPSFVSGCTGLQHELHVSRYPYLMYRCAWCAITIPLTSFSSWSPWNIEANGRAHIQHLISMLPIGWCKRQLA